jgi:hypothetical protein
MLKRQRFIDFVQIEVVQNIANQIGLGGKAGPLFAFLIQESTIGGSEQQANGAPI